MFFKRTPSLAAVLTATALLFAPNASASLLGDSVKACWTTLAQLANCPSGGFNAFTQPNATGDMQTVVEGDTVLFGTPPEFFGPLAGPFAGIFSLPATNTLLALVDVDSSSFTAALITTGVFGPLPPTALLLWDLEWLDGGIVVPGTIDDVTLGLNELGVTPDIQFGNDLTLGNTILVIFPAGIVLDGTGGFDGVAAEFLIEASHIPEPGTLVLFGLGLAGLGLARRRKAAA